ncbi:MAG: efflux RND transporter periplasmic adaptor subunit [Deltaproteobacteria bacterium]|nr:MAG: efflux RND transporter periplasmic adaptor subunit [Deltaproteobacteria bacterium]
MSSSSLHRVWRLVAVPLAGLAVASMLACSMGGDGGDEWGGGRGGRGGWGGKKSSVEPATVVELSEVGTSGVSELLLTSALVESERSANLVPSATGVVLSIHKDEGDVVKKGDLLAVIENVSLDASAERARAEVTKLEAQTGELEQLYQRGAISQRELEDAQYQLATARTSLREASRSYGNTRLTAPFDGVVASRGVKVGELASSGTTAFSVVDLDALRVVASLPERDVARVSVGQKTRLVSAYDEDLFAWGKVERVSPVIDASSGTFRVTIAIDEGQATLRPGQFVSVEIEVDRHEDVTVVSRRAVVYEDGEPIVYRKALAPEDDGKGEDGEDASADADGGGDQGRRSKRYSSRRALSGMGGGGKGGGEDEDKEPPLKSPWIAERVALEVGLTDAEYVEVLDGVKVGDEIVVVGQSNLRDGAPILTPEKKAELKAQRAAEAKAEGEEKAGEEG